MYLDTSLLAALYIPEALSAKAAAAVGAATPTISSLSQVEFASVVARRMRERTISAADGNAVLGMFDAHVAARRFRQLPLTSETLAGAAKLLRSGGVALATLDALHLAIAASHREPLCTADRQFARAAAHFGVKVSLVRP